MTNLNNSKTKKMINYFTARFNTQAALFEESRYAAMAILLTVQSCVGSIACKYILQNAAGDSMLVSSAIITMVCNAVLIAQGSAKLCLFLFYSSLIVNSIFILLNI